MSARALEFIAPGDLQSATGGYVYDRRMIAELQMLGWRVTVHTLDEGFPLPSAASLARAAESFASLPDAACTLIDGLALGALPDLIESHRQRLTVIALIHAPLGTEVGLAPAVAARLQGQEQRALQSSRHVIVTSRATERALLALGISAAHLSVVEPGTAAAALAPRRAQGPVELLCVATLNDGKAHALLAEVLAPLQHLPWHLTCVGSLTRNPPTVCRFKDLLLRLGLADRVTLAGEVAHEAMSRFYQAADLFVLPTLRESYCMAVAEAVAHGLPVISTRTGAIAELTAGGAALLAEPGDAEALRSCLTAALLDPSLRSRLAAGAARARARLRRWPQAATELSQILERVCGQPRPKAGAG